MHSLSILGTTLAFRKDELWRVAAACAVLLVFVPAVSYLFELPLLWAAATPFATAGLSVAAFAFSVWWRGTKAAP